MPLVVEDGSGYTDSNAYVSLADFVAYHTDRGRPDLDADDEAAEAAIIRATQYIDGKYGHRWAGYKIYGRDQALTWPRSGAYDNEDNYIFPDEVPAEVVNATCEAAYRELQEPGSLSPDVTLSARIKREQVGPLAVEYMDDKSPEASRPVVTIIDEILAPLLPPRTAKFVGEAIRG